MGSVPIAGFGNRGFGKGSFTPFQPFSPPPSLRVGSASTVPITRIQFQTAASQQPPQPDPAGATPVVDPVAAGNAGYNANAPGTQRVFGAPSDPLVFDIFQNGDSEPESDDEEFARKRTVVKTIDIAEIPNAAGLRTWTAKLRKECCTSSNRRKARCTHNEVSYESF